MKLETSRFLVIAVCAAIVLNSCKSDSADSQTDGAKQKDLENRIEQLELENSMKDSVINESLSYFNEIRSNLESISIRKDQLKVLSADPELSVDDKQWILEEIKRINFLREENARKVTELNEQLSKNGVKIRQLEIMIESLLKDIQWKDDQISLLQTELNNLDQEYSKLFDAYQVQSIKLDQMREELNKVFYAYGSEKELSQNKVIEKQNGFIGIGRKTELREDFNEKYFTEINASRTKEIIIRGENLRFITNHPISSYQLEEGSNKTKLKILDGSEFWKLSKYLVIVVD